MIDARERHREIRRVLLWTLLANVIVVAGKAGAGLAANTLSVVAEAAHSSVDAWNNLMALVIARVAAEAPDEKHPYGHAKFETLGALAVVAFLSITVFEVVTGAIRRLIRPDELPQATPYVVGVMLVSAVVSALVARYETRKGQELRSDLLLADAAHTRSDVYASAAVLAGLGLVALGYAWADAVVSLLVALVIARAGWRIVRGAVPMLVDERAVEVSVIERIARESPGVLDCYDVRSRGRFGSMFIELTVAVPNTLDVERAHDIADGVEQRVIETLGANEVVVHVEPASARLQRPPRFH